MSGIGTYDGKDTRTIKLPATSRLVSFADVDHDKNNDDDRTICSTSSTSVCNNIEIWKMPDEVANEQTGGVCPIVEALLSPAQEFECPAKKISQFLNLYFTRTSIIMYQSDIMIIIQAIGITTFIA